MVVIRLARHGKKGAPIFKIKVADRDYALTGRYLEKVGVYTPGAKANALVLDTERYNYWLSKGAQATDRVKKVLAIHGTTTAVAPAAPAAKTAAAKK